MKLVLTDEAPARSPETGAQQIAGILQRYRATSDELTERQVNVRGAQLDIAERHAQQVLTVKSDVFTIGSWRRTPTADVRLGWLSPAVAFDVTSAAFAGTDFAHHRHFIDFAESYRRRLVNRMNADLIPNPAVEDRSARTTSHSGPRSRPSITRRCRLRRPGGPWRLRCSRLTFWAAASVALAAIVTRRVRP